MLGAAVDQGSQTPEFVGGSRLLAQAYRFANRAHGDPVGAGETEISHPVAVAEILADAGFNEQVIAAALLHDVVEDTAHDQEEILAEFGEPVSALVEVLTEDDSIAEYPERKAEHRDRVLAGGRVPASIYLADKLARVRRYKAEGAGFEAARLAHYRRTVELFGEHDPSLPFLTELRAELPAS